MSAALGSCIHLDVSQASTLDALSTGQEFLVSSLPSIHTAFVCVLVQLENLKKRDPLPSQWESSILLGCALWEPGAWYSGDQSPSYHVGVLGR